MSLTREYEIIRCHGVSPRSAVDGRTSDELNSYSASSCLPQTVLPLTSGRFNYSVVSTTNRGPWARREAFWTRGAMDWNLSPVAVNEDRIISPFLARGNNVLDVLVTLTSMSKKSQNQLTNLYPAVRFSFYNSCSSAASRWVMGTFEILWDQSEKEKQKVDSKVGLIMCGCSINVWNSMEENINDYFCFFFFR